MAVLRMGQAKTLLEPKLTGSGGEQITPTHHLSDTHTGVVYHHSKLVGVNSIGPAEDKDPYEGEGLTDLPA